MTSPWIPTHEQLKECFRAIKKNFNYGKTKVKCSCKLPETNNEKKKELLKKTSHWDYGKDSDPKKKSNLGADSVLPRLDSNGMKKALSDVIAIHDTICDNHKTALYLLSIIENTHNFWLLNEVDHSNGDKIFFNDDGDIRVSRHALLGEFNLYQAIGDSSEINEELYHSELCIYYDGKRYSFWMKRSGRSSLGISIQSVRDEYRPSHCPSVLVDIDGNLFMVLCGSEIIDNTKHIGFGYCNIIKKLNRKGKGSGIISGHSIIDIWKENMRDVHVEFYAFDKSIINMHDITVKFEWNNLKENGESIVLSTQTSHKNKNNNNNNNNDNIINNNITNNNNNNQDNINNINQYNNRSYSPHSTTSNNINYPSYGTMPMVQNYNNHQAPNGPLPLPPLYMIMQDMVNNTNSNPQQTGQETVRLESQRNDNDVSDSMTVLSEMTNTTMLPRFIGMETSSLIYNNIGFFDAESVSSGSQSTAYGAHHTSTNGTANMRFSPMWSSRI